MVPYNALLPDMIDDYVTRSKYTGVRMVFSTFGAILSGLIPTLLITDNTNASSYFMVALIFAVIFFVVILITFFGTWERQKKPIQIGLRESIKQSFTVYKSKSFRIFILIFVFGQCATDFVTGMAVYFIDDVLNAYGGGRFTYLMAVILLAQFVGTIVFSVSMPKTSKKFPLLVGAPIRIVATIAMLFFSHEGANFTMILALSFVIGLGMAGTSTTIYALLADLADVDELITSVNRPGTCSAMATFIRKIATGLSATVIGFLLTLAGYSETLAAAGQRQSAATQQGIAYIYIFAPIILTVISFVCVMRFPMNQKEFEVIKREIGRRKGEDSSSATAEEIAICEKVTGYSYNRLWDTDNAYKLKNGK